MSALERQTGELARRYGLAPGAAGPLRALRELLAEDPLAPTALREPQRVLDDHLADALVALELDPVRSAATVADIGSGAGVPGLPLAIAMPAAQFALVESSARKSSFIARAVAVCGLRNVRVVNARVEGWRAGIGRFDVVTARAVAPLAVVVEYAAPLLAESGHLVAWRGRRDSVAEAAADAAAGELGLSAVDVFPVQPFPAAKSRHLHVFVKDRVTPSSFPRRPGMAQKRPLGRGARSV